MNVTDDIIDTVVNSNIMEIQQQLTWENNSLLHTPFYKFIYSGNKLVHCSNNNKCICCERNLWKRFGEMWQLNMCITLSAQLICRFFTTNIAIIL